MADFLLLEPTLLAAASDSNNVGNDNPIAESDPTCRKSRRVTPSQVLAIPFPMNSSMAQPTCRRTWNRFVTLGESSRLEARRAPSHRQSQFTQPNLPNPLWTSRSGYSCAVAADVTPILAAWPDIMYPKWVGCGTSPKRNNHKTSHAKANAKLPKNSLVQVATNS